ncbi:GNAT family N-acetyltransferase [Christensenellaceae bacterium OttesenSCG-928-K19]|nr:GNAT family N-acetyltransferase [Christensenellaceae bacterium OttesenSCG-928-K19]
MEGLQIRKLRKEELPLLEEFLYHAIYQGEEGATLPHAIIKEPSLAVYIDCFGKKDDHCLVADYHGKVIGAVWARVFAGEPKGFGYLDNQTPELAMSLLPGYRGKGVGTMLIKAMLALLKTQGYRRVSLSVQKSNYAVSLYQKVGFVVVSATKDETIMAAQLS